MWYYYIMTPVNHDKTIVFFGSQITVGGAQRVLLDQAERFRQLGYNVRAVFFYDKDGLLPEWQAANEFPITALSTYTRGAGAVKNLRGVVGGFFKLIRYLRKEHADVIECFTHDADLLGIPAAWIAGVPRRFGSHHGRFDGMSSAVKSMHTFVINSRLTRKLICVSDRARSQALEEGIHEGKITVIVNGVRRVETSPEIRAEVRKELGLSESDVMVLNVGRLVPEKAQVNLIRAAAKVPAAKFFIAGGGPLKDTLAKEIADEGLDGRFTLLGSRDDVPRLLNAADVFVLYSDTEGMPISVMEAMSAGLPVVASDLSGIRQLIPDESFGTLLEPGDPDALAEALNSLIADPAKRAAQSAKAAKRIAEEFSIEASCARYEEVFFE